MEWNKPQYCANALLPTIKFSTINVILWTSRKHFLYFPTIGCCCDGGWHGAQGVLIKIIFFNINFSILPNFIGAWKEGNGEIFNEDLKLKITFCGVDDHLNCNLLHFTFCPFNIRFYREFYSLHFFCAILLCRDCWNSAKRFTYKVKSNLCLQSLKINFLVAAIAHVMLKINGFLLTMNNHVIKCHFLNWNYTKFSLFKTY